MMRGECCMSSRLKKWRRCLSFAALFTRNLRNMFRLYRSLSLLTLFFLLSRCGEDQENYPTVIADFSTDSKTIFEGESITFTDESTGEPTEWEWMFEGGTPATSTDANPRVTYEKKGTYTVQLVARNPENSSNLARPYYIRVFSASPRIASDSGCDSSTDSSVSEAVEEVPRPDGGLEAFHTHIAESITYPELARREGIEGKVFVQFVINQQGQLTCARVLEGLGYGCDEEALQAVQSFPSRWIPGQKNDLSVSTRLVVPITFKLG